MANTYGIGNGVKVSVKFKDTSTGQYVDPSSIVIHIKNPSLSITTLTYGIDAALQKASTGSYFVIIDGNADGTWGYRWEGTGTNQAAAENTFIITPSNF